MRLIDADALIEFCAERWIPLNIDAVNMQPTIQPEKAQLSCEGATKGTTSDLISRQAAIDAITNCTNCGNEKTLREYVTKHSLENGWTGGVLNALDAVQDLPSAQPEPKWISVTERLPDNADHPGAFCPRYQVVTPYGVTEGWYRPHDHEKGGQWFALFWFMSQIYEIWNIDFERGDVPKVIGEAPVMEWRPLPEPYKPNK